jgi:hypothetical protein
VPRRSVQHASPARFRLLSNTGPAIGDGQSMAASDWHARKRVALLDRTNDGGVHDKHAAWHVPPHTVGSLIGGAGQPYGHGQNSQTACRALTACSRLGPAGYLV